MAPHEKIPVRRQGSKQACANEKFQKREKLARQGNKIHLHVQRGASEKSQPLVWRAVHARMQTFSATSLVSWAPTLHAADRYMRLLVFVKMELRLVYTDGGSIIYAGDSTITPIAAFWHG